MRIIKLSERDADMRNREMVDRYFTEYLPGRNGERFYVPRGFISKSHFTKNEKLVFSYKMEVIYFARSKSGILDTDSTNKRSTRYPQYFLIDPASITPASGRLDELESKLDEIGVLFNLAKDGAKIPKRITSRGWPSIHIPKDKEKEWKEIAALFKATIGDYVAIPEEIGAGQTYSEGSVTQVVVNRYERDPNARNACIRHYGAKCSICTFEFKHEYGDQFSGFIHVHHIKEISSIKKEYVVDPIKDLIPVCPNCHAIIHRRTPPYTIEEMHKIRKGA